MPERLRTIRLYGLLGARFGRKFRLAVSNPAEAVRALCAILLASSSTWRARKRAEWPSPYSSVSRTYPRIS